MEKPEYEDKFDDREYFEQREREEEEEDFYREILGLKESYSDSLDIKYEDKQTAYLEEKLRNDRRELKSNIKNSLKEIVIISGSLFAGVQLINYAALTAERENSMSYTSAIIGSFGLGLLSYGLYKAITDISYTIRNKGKNPNLHL